MRVIARLDIKGSHLIKGKQFEGYRKLGDPREFSIRYAEAGVDELLFVDNVASLYGSEPMLETLRRVTEDVFLPITVAGGIDSVKIAHHYLRNGADKVAVNSAALKRPGLLKELVDEIGSQSVLSSVEVKRQISGSHRSWECMGNFGRDHSGRRLEDWLEEVQNLGVGEVLVTSIDHDGMLEGFDTGLSSLVSSITRRPIIFSGGISTSKHVRELTLRPSIDAIAVGTALHSLKVKPAELGSVHVNS
jgi:cyclase